MDKSPDCLLSLRQALDFAEHRLGVANVPDRVKTDPLGLLNDLTRAFLNTVPYQNLVHCSVDFPQRHTPSPWQCVEDVLRGVGGMCWTLAVFMFELLRALGYDVTPCLSSVATPDTNNHMIILCRDVTRRGDTYLVDVGYGYPSFCAIPLDFDQESPSYSLSFLTFKYVKRPDGVTIRMHLRSPASRYAKFPTVEADGWEHAYYFRPEQPCSLATIESWMNRQVYHNPDMFFNNEIRFVRFHNDRCLAIKGSNLMLEGPDGKFQSTELGKLTDDELVEKIAFHLPQVPREIILPAIRYTRALKTRRAEKR